MSFETLITAFRATIAFIMSHRVFDKKIYKDIESRILKLTSRSGLFHPVNKI